MNFAASSRTARGRRAVRWNFDDRAPFVPIRDLCQSSFEECTMSKVALYVPLEAKPGKEKEVADFLKSALPLVNAEPGTVTWFAIQESPSSFAIFDTFDDEAGREAHLNGKVAAALMAKAGELLAKPPTIHKIDILTDKLPK
jgi:quinol monooxygenase YgiN